MPGPKREREENEYYKDGDTMTYWRDDTKTYWVPRMPTKIYAIYKPEYLTIYGEVGNYVLHEAISGLFKNPIVKHNKNTDEMVIYLKDFNHNIHYLKCKFAGIETHIAFEDNKDNRYKCDVEGTTKIPIDLFKIRIEWDSWVRFEKGIVKKWWQFWL